MAGTFADELALPGGRWAFNFQVAGWGRLLTATSTTRRLAYRLTTDHPRKHGQANVAETFSHLELLERPSGTTGDEIDLRAGETLLGELTVTLLDLPIDEPSGEDHGWLPGVPLISQLLADHAPASTWELAEDIDLTETAWDLVSIAGIVVGQMLHAGSEVVCVTVLAPGGVANRLTVLRAQQGTQAQVHRLRTSYPPGEGTIYSRPQYVQGRECWLYANLWDHRGGDVDKILPVAQQRLLWRGYLDTWEQTSDGGGYTLHCRPALGRLDALIGQDQWHATVRLPAPSDDGQIEQRTVETGGSLQAEATVPAGEGIPPAPDAPDSGGMRYFHARIGDQIVEVGCETLPAGSPNPWVSLDAWGLLRSKAAVPEQDAELWDVLLTTPDSIGVHAVRRFVSPVDATRTYTHPAEIVRALAQSSGGTSGAEWDCLPATWSVGVPLAELADGAWKDVVKRTPSLKTPNHVIGAEGKPVSLRRWAMKALGPWGIWLYQDHTGLIAIGHIAELYPSDSWPSVTCAAGTARLVGQTDQTIGGQTWQYGHDLQGRAQRVVRYLHPQARERMQLAGEDALGVAGVRDVLGLDQEQGGAALGLIRAAALTAGRWWTTPVPRVRWSAGLGDLALDLTRGVKLTAPELPDPYTGLRGMVDRPAVVVRRSIDLDRNALELELILLPAPHVGLWAPSGTIAAPLHATQLTLAAGDYTPGAGETWDQVPATDAEGFHVGDLVQLATSKGARLCDVPRTVVAVPPTTPANRIDISAAFTLGGVPAVMAAGQQVRFAQWSGGAAPQAAWTATMQHHVAQAAATGLLPDGAAAYVYGGV